MSHDVNTRIIVSAKDTATSTFRRVRTELKNVERQVFSLRTGFMALGVGLAGRSLLKVAAGFEDIEASLKTITGSSAAAERSMAWITEFTSRTPYDLEQVAGGFRKLSAYGFDAVKFLPSLGDTASAMGKDLDQAVEMLADAATGEFERLKEFGVRAKQEGNKVTFSWSENGKEMIRVASKTQAGITGALGQIFSRFDGAMKTRMSSWRGISSNIRDIITQTKLAVMRSGPFDELKRQAQGFQRYLSSPEGTKALESFADDVGTISTGVLTLSGAITRDLIPSIRSMVEEINKIPGPLQSGLLGAGVGLAVTRSPYGALAGGVVGSVASQWSDRYSERDRARAEYWDKVHKQNLIACGEQQGALNIGILADALGNKLKAHRETAKQDELLIELVREYREAHRRPDRHSVKERNGLLDEIRALVLERRQIVAMVNGPQLGRAGGLIGAHGAGVSSFVKPALTGSTGGANAFDPAAWFKEWKANHEQLLALVKAADTSSALRLFNARRDENPVESLNALQAGRQAQLAAEQAAQEERKRIILEFNREYLSVTMDQTQFAIHQVEAQAQAWKEAGANEVAVSRYVAVETKRIREEAAKAARRPLEQYADAARFSAKKMESAMLNSVKSIGDSFVNLVSRGKLEFSDLVTSIIADFARLATQNYITGPLSSGLSSVIQSLFNGSPNTTAMAGNPGLALATGNYHAKGAAYERGVRRFAAGGVVTRPTLFRLARGTGLMGEAGPEGILPLKRTASGDLGVQASGGSALPVVNININNQTGHEIQAQAHQPRWDGRQWVINVVMDAVQRNSSGMRTMLSGVSLRG